MKNWGSQGGSKVRLGNKIYIMNANLQKYTHPIIQYYSCLVSMKFLFGRSLNWRWWLPSRYVMCSTRSIQRLNWHWRSRSGQYAMWTLSVVSKVINERKDGLTLSNERYWFLERLVRLTQANKHWQSGSTRYVVQTILVVGTGRNDQKDRQTKQGDNETRDVTGHPVQAGERVS